MGEFFSASNKLPGTVRKLTGNQFSSILTCSKMCLSAFQPPMHEQRQGKIVTGKNTCCNLCLMSCFAPCLGAHCHFVSITRRALAGAIDSTEHPSIQLNKQRGGRAQRSITVGCFPEWMGLFLDLCVQLLPSL